MDTGHLRSVFSKISLFSYQSIEGVFIFSQIYLAQDVASCDTLLLWKLYHAALPVVDNLRRFAMVFPSCCPLCRSSKATEEHLFLHCPVSRDIWTYCAISLDGPLPVASLLSS